MTDQSRVVLIVADDPDPAERYARWLDEYAVRTAPGRDALDALDDADIVVLDRASPGADEVLDAIRERGLGVHVATVAGSNDADPDPRADARLVEPVSERTLRRAVSILIDRQEYETGVRELFSLASRKASIEAERGDDGLETDETYRDLADRVDERRERLDETLESLVEETDFSDVYRDIQRDAGDDRTDA